MVGGNALHLKLFMRKLTLFVIKVDLSRSNLVIGLLRDLVDIDTGLELSYKISTSSEQAPSQRHVLPFGRF